MGLSKKLIAQLHRSAALLPPPLGAPRRVETTEGPVVMTMTGAGLRLEEIHPAPPQSGMPWQFDRVEVINRPDRPEKKLALATHLREIAWPFREPEWHVAIPGNQLPPPPSDWRSTRNIWAGNQSHLTIIQRAYDDGLDSVLIMEDDCLYLPGFLERMKAFMENVPSDWGMLYFGGRFAPYREIGKQFWGGGVVREPQRIHVGRGVYRVCGLNNIESYAVHRRFMPSAIKCLRETRFHADVALNLIQWDAPTYHMIPVIAQQRAGWSDNFGNYKSDRESRLSVKKNAGAMILSTGKKRRHLLANSAASFRRNNPSLGLRIFTDVEWAGYDITKADDTKTGLSSRHQKTRMLRESPFATGILLDDDTITLRPIPSVESVLGDCDIALAPDAYSTMGSILRSEKQEVAVWLSREEAAYTLQNYPGCDDVPHYNTGVIFYRKTDAVCELSRLWHEEWKRFGKIDQIAFFRAVQRTGIKVKLLPRELHDMNGKSKASIIVHLISEKKNFAQWMKSRGIAIVATPEPVVVGCCGAKKKPTLMQKAASAARALGGVLADVATGETVLASKEVRATRLAACSACPSLKSRRCEICECFVSLKTKLRREACPAGKW